jgi:hypothetical protein
MLGYAWSQAKVLKECWQRECNRLQMKQEYVKQSVVFLAACLMLCVGASAQFIDDFNESSIAKDPQAITGWAFFTGDGLATMDFVPGDGFASVVVDATKDKRNIWWALIKRCVSADMDLGRLSKPEYEFRIEARIRVSHAPRRVNLHLNTQRTTDFHSHLMEFDIPDTTKWHTISMTTQGFDARPGDKVFGQMALMDWGLGKYRVDVDYIRVDIVDITKAGPDKGVAVVYRPPVPDVNTFENAIKVEQDCTLDTQYPDMNFNSWCAQGRGVKTNILSVNGTQLVILRWDLSGFKGKKISGSGLLELTTYSVECLSDDIKDFGQVRVVEILGGDANWNQERITYSSFCQGQSEDKVLNSQMIIDCEVTEERGGKTLITISQPVLQRMIEARTLGLAIRPLGAINASFYAQENKGGKFSARLLFNTQEIPRI